ncbi:MAG: ATP-dependent DNA helicase RecG [Melioribacteraceae bacterium]|nr:ATP-dependent DNA helicase RecG [Melioribacteraceae bacterium]
MTDKLSGSIQYLKNVGPKRVKAFQSIGLETIEDLLFYLPTKYLDRSTILNSSAARRYISAGSDSEFTLIGTVERTDVISYSRKPILKLTLRDSAGTFDCVWFQGLRFIKDLFKSGESYAVSGKPVITKYGHLQFAHPDFDKIEEDERREFMNTGRIIPFYKLANELKKTNIGNISLRKIIYSAVLQYAKELEETLPDEVLTKNKLLNIVDAIQNLHFPKSTDLLHEALRRIKYEELFYIEMMIAVRKTVMHKKVSEFRYKVNSDSILKFISNLNFKLTSEQKKVINEISADLKSGKVMFRLLQGDVGSGKTIVALIIMLAAVENGIQAALMAPTEVLASQHYHNIKNYLKNFNVDIRLLTGGTSRSERKQLEENLQTNDRMILIGTHALFEDVVQFSKLGLVVIDEQHRFGVSQRYKLIDKGVNPHVLVMTATPIPRTLTMTTYGDLDISTINELPDERLPVKTALRSERKLNDIYKFIIERLNNDEQAFLIYPLVEDSEKLQLKSAMEEFNSLKRTVFKDYKVGLLHGKMPWTEKESVMNRFADGHFNILISTTVIEVGIDVPNTTVILINDAHRFGLSQLHQLRGRVGRSNKQSYCILVTKEEFIKYSLPKNLSVDLLSPAEREKYKTHIRLQSMINHSNGFELSEIDLKLRGPGDMFGTKQSGLPDLKYSNIIEDVEILYQAKEDAFNLVKNDFSLKEEKNFLLRKILMNKYLSDLTLSLTP